MKKAVFVLIIASLLFYNIYQIVFFIESNRVLEKELFIKSNKIAETINYFLKSTMEKNYIIDELFYKVVFSEFKNFEYSKSQNEYLYVDEKLNKISGKLDEDISKYAPKLREIVRQKLSVVEIRNDKNYILMAGYKKSGLILIVKFTVKPEIKSEMSIESFKKNIMAEDEVKDIIISGSSKGVSKNVSNSDSRVINKVIKIYDSINDDEIKYNIAIIFDMKNYKRTMNKNLYDIIFGISVSLIILVLVIVYNFLNNRLIETKEYIKDKEKEILLGSVAAGVAHEIRNPLNSINYSIEFLKSFIKEEKAHKYFDIIMGEIKRIDISMKEFLDIRKEIQLNLEKLQVSEVIKECVELLRAEFNTIGIKLFFEEHDEIVMNGDRNKLKEVFINLMKNSKEALEKREDRCIKVILYKNRIDFIDNGIGMSKEEQDKVFNLYFTTKESGNGIGLYRTKKIIEAHGGTIKLDSKKDHGTRVLIEWKQKKDIK